MKIHHIFAIFLFAISSALVSPLALANQGPDSAGNLKLSDYEYFTLYPRLDKAFRALEAGEESVAIREFKHVQQRVPQNVPVLLMLVEAYRHFGRNDEAEKALRLALQDHPHDQRLLTQLDALPVTLIEITNVTELQDAARSCEAKPSEVCRNHVGYGALRLGEFDVTLRQLDDTAYAATTSAKLLQEALLERLIHTKNWQRIDDFQTRFADKHQLTEEARRRWFQALMNGGLDVRFLALQAEGVFPGPAYSLDYAANLLARNDKKKLHDYLQSTNPVFVSAEQERSWIYLLTVVDAWAGSKLLEGFEPHFPDNSAFVADMLLPDTLERADPDAAVALLKHLPPDEYLNERYQISRLRGDREEALRVAQAVYHRDGQTPQALDLYTWRLLELGDEEAAFRALVESYPFDLQSDLGLTLLTRLHVLLPSHQATLSPTEHTLLMARLATPALRERQATSALYRGNCNNLKDLLGDFSEAYGYDTWTTIAHCYQGGQAPGVVAHAYERAVARAGAPHDHAALAFQYFELQDYATANEAWKQIAEAMLTDEQLQAAARTADLATDMARRDHLLTLARERGLDNTEDYWWLMSRTPLAQDDLELALSYLDRARAVEPTARVDAMRAEILRRQGSLPEAEVAVMNAIRLEPQNAHHQASLGYIKWDLNQMREAKVTHETALRAFPDDLGLVRHLSFIDERLDEVETAQGHIKRIVDDIDDQAELVPLTEEQTQERFDFRRMHEQVGRKWTLSANASLGLTRESRSGYDPASGNAEALGHRSFSQIELDYKIGKNQIIQDDQLSAYGRIFADSGEQGHFMPLRNPMLGVGLRWKPLREQILFLSLEQQIPLSHHGKADTLIRMSGSFFNQGQYSDDWHPNGSGWFAQNLYLDAGHYFRRNAQTWTIDYRISWHQKITSNQTIEPYLRAQTYGYRESHTVGAHLLAMGVRWNIWLGARRYDAWPHKFSIGIEAQRKLHSFHQDTDNKNSIFLNIGFHW